MVFFLIIQGCWDCLNGGQVYFLHPCICSSEVVNCTPSTLQPHCCLAVTLHQWWCGHILLQDHCYSSYHMQVFVWVSTAVPRRDTRWWGNLWWWISMIFVCFMYQHHIRIGLTCTCWMATHTCELLHPIFEFLSVRARLNHSEEKTYIVTRNVAAKVKSLGELRGCLFSPWDFKIAYSNSGQSYAPDYVVQFNSLKASLLWSVCVVNTHGQLNQLFGIRQALRILFVWTSSGNSTFLLWPGKALV